MPHALASASEEPLDHVEAILMRTFDAKILGLMHRRVSMPARFGSTLKALLDRCEPLIGEIRVNLDNSLHVGAVYNGTDVIEYAREQMCRRYPVAPLELVPSKGIILTVAVLASSSQSSIQCTRDIMSISSSNMDIESLQCIAIDFLQCVAEMANGSLNVSRADKFIQENLFSGSMERQGLPP